MRRPGFAARVVRDNASREFGGSADVALDALREVAHAALTAERVDDALQFALDRIGPIVGAEFASAYVAEFSGDDSNAAGDERDGAPEAGGDLLRLAAAHNWPDQWRPWLGQMRVRVGSGPSGEAASERRVVEVPDVFADPALTDWQEVASELGVRALTALPLASGTRVYGAVTFYFREAGGLTTTARNLLRAAADQMALAAAKAEASAQARRALSRIAEAEGDAERQTVAALEAARSRDEFLSNVSHELKTPLTVVLGTIDLLSEELGGPLTEAQRGDLTLAREQSERLLGLVETLLALSALRRGALPVAVEEFDPREPLREAASIMAAHPPRAGVEFRVEAPHTFIPRMRGDREKIVRILVSLLDNAFKFTERGVVRAAVDVSAGRVRYYVDDTGIGIATSAQESVFEEFRQGDGSATRRYGGAGLGLALARGLARLLGGDIEMTSVEGEGSRFRTEIPLEAE